MSIWSVVDFDTELDFRTYWDPNCRDLYTLFYWIKQITGEGDEA